MVPPIVTESAGAAKSLATIVVLACDTLGRISGVGRYTQPVLSLNVSEWQTTVVPTLAMVVLLTSAVKPAAAPAGSRATGVGADPPEPDVVCPLIICIRIISSAASPTSVDCDR